MRWIDLPNEIQVDATDGSSAAIRLPSSGAGKGSSRTYELLAIRADLNQTLRHAVRDQAPVALTTSPPQPKPMQAAVKRMVDITASGLGILLLLPVLLLIAAAIKLTSKGPIFFRQSRTGYGNRPFQILKFRSMYTDRCDVTGVSQTVEDDPRITPVGRFLRRTNLDELPQLFNVLVGDMSLVGPRPHVAGMLAFGQPYESLVIGYENRHNMRPGITGLAQVCGYRGPTAEWVPAVVRVAMDLKYVEEFSLWLDMKILVHTVFREIRGGTGF